VLEVGGLWMGCACHMCSRGFMACVAWCLAMGISSRWQILVSSSSFTSGSLPRETFTKKGCLTTLRSSSDRES
jgi:hypothetical protein